MNRFFGAALIAAIAIPAVSVPSVASAQARGTYERHDDRHDRRDYRQDRRDDRRDARRDRREDRRDARWDRRDDRRDRAHRWAENDWRHYRNANRAYFARGHWNAPFRYTRFRAGVRIAPAYYGTRFVIADPWRYHLPPLRAGYLRYVRHYDDVLVIDMRRGVVVRVYNNFYW
ncbi:RcnB family protein [Stakelama tenebrarum]|uniref:RcnB family protein n=1 Tax=Stakelama tenebrarum TaxID=2711215 RepID=A0A6G6Y2K7_9SPHN|nr:RcnB family protein [Sphingosinithalassobacter tenebrarum]QIG78806.1 RcnB family protein [Sphingosinithalassobacter tenebrarum]